MIYQELKNQRKVTLIQRLKSLYLKIRYKNRIIISGDLRIIGNMPSFKLPGEGKIWLGDKVVLNSDSKNSNTALTFNCTLVCELNGTIKIGNNTMLNGVSITSYEEVKIGENCQIASCTLISDTDFYPIDPYTRLKESMGYKIDFSLVN